MRFRFHGRKTRILALGSAQAGGYSFRLTEFQPREPASEPIGPEAPETGWPRQA